MKLRAALNDRRLTLFEGTLVDVCKQRPDVQYTVASLLDHMVCFVSCVHVDMRQSAIDCEHIQRRTHTPIHARAHLSTHARAHLPTHARTHPPAGLDAAFHDQRGDALGAEADVPEARPHLLALLLGERSLVASVLAEARACE